MYVPLFLLSSRRKKHMKIIEDISKDIEKEICSAECYAKKALEYKDSYPAVAEHYYKAAT